MIFPPPTHPQDPPPELPGAITRLALLGGLIVTLAVPVIFLAIGYQSESARLEIALQAGTQAGARQLRDAGGVSGPETAFPKYVVDSLGWLGSDMDISLSSPDKGVLAEKRYGLKPPIVTRTATINQGKTGVLQLEVARSLQPLFITTLVIFIPGLLLGLVTYFALKDVPTRAFRLALQEIGIRKSTEERLAKSLAIFSATLESTADGILVTDVAGRAVVTNQRFVDLWNLPESSSRSGADGDILTILAYQLRDPVAFANTHKDLTRHIDVDHGAVLELRDGRLFEWNSRPQHVDGTVVGRVSSFRDISERKRAEALLAAEKEVLELVVCGSPLSTALNVLARHVEALSGQMFCTILFRENSEDEKLACATGHSLPQAAINELVDKGQTALAKAFADVKTREIVHTHGVEDESGEVIDKLETNPAWAPYREAVSKHGIRPFFAVSIRSSKQQLGIIIAHYRKRDDQPAHDRELVCVAAHLTGIAIERRQAETRLRIMAHYDALTRLPNRDLFRDRLHQAMAHAERRNALVAVMFLDLDRFKMVNDTLGHDAGDVLLREVSERLRKCVRQEDTVARLGGDEFTVILEGIARPEDAAIVASKIVEGVSPPILLGGQEAFVTPSIGITIYPLDSDNAETLLKNADTAMYRTKEQGGNGYRFFTPDMNTLAAGRLEMESGLRRALERQEFVIYYQPKFHLRSQTIIGAEALLRWKHPDRGLVSPGEFIPILEETGLIEPVGLWVMKAVCEQICAWQRAGMPFMTVAVNLSGRQLQRDNLATTIGEILDETGLDPRYLELEVTESMLMHDPKYAANMLMDIRAKGVVHIDVDDFGTGYSSLSYLKSFPIDALKLDKSFVTDLPHDDDDAAISRAVIAMAHSLKLQVVAEGVENEDQLAFLRKHGCDIIQGYLISPPLPAQKFAELVQGYRQKEEDRVLV